jgi:hypothetical protein
MYMQEARARVAKGAALLDAKRPGWFKKIDWRHLRIDSCESCVIGQLFNLAETGGIGFTASLERLGVFNAAVYGFGIDGRLGDADSKQGSWRPLGRAWRQAITERLTPPAIWTHRETVPAIGAERCEQAEAVVP